MQVMVTQIWDTLYSLCSSWCDQRYIPYLNLATVPLKIFWTILSSAVIFKLLHGSLLWLLALTHLRMCAGFPPACRNSDLVLEFQLGENDIVSYSEMNHVSRAGRDQNLLTASIQQKSGTCPQFNSLYQISPSQKPTPRLAFRS